MTRIRRFIVGVLPLWGALLLGQLQFASADDSAKVIWYSTLESGLAEAKRSVRPILLISAAPHCTGVSGIW